MQSGRLFGVETVDRLRDRYKTSFAAWNCIKDSSLESFGLLHDSKGQTREF